MAQPPDAAAVTTTSHSSTSTLSPPPQTPLTATSHHEFSSYESLRAFVGHYAHDRGFEVRWETKGSAYSSAHGGKAVCWCSRPNPNHSQPQQPAVDDNGSGGSGVRKKRRRKVTYGAEQVLCGCRWFVNFNRRGEGAHSSYSITTRNLAHNGDQYSQHDERTVLTLPQQSVSIRQPMDEASVLQERMAVVVEAGVRSALSSRAEYGSVLADEQTMKRAVQLDKKRDGRLVCYAAKQCAAAINRQHHHQQQQYDNEQKDSSAMTDITSPPLAAASAEELSEAMAVAIRTQVALDEQLAAAVEVTATGGFVNIDLHIAPTLTAATSASSHPSAVVSFPTFPPPASSSSASSSLAAVSLPPSYLFPSIGTFHSIYNEKYGTPRQGSVTPHSRGRLVLHPHVDSQSLDGLSLYSHVWLLFVFHLNTNTAVRAKVRPPRLGAKVGVFATRTPHRPSPIGMTVARVERVELDKRTVHVSGVDIVDGTPVVDIKPYHPADCVSAATVPQWVADSGGRGGLEVRVQSRVRDEMRRWAVEGRLAMYDSGDDALAAIVECISGDPRTLNAKKKHRHTYGTAQKTEVAAVEEKEEEGGRRGEGEEDEVVEEVEAEEAEGDDGVAAAGTGSVIYGVSVDRVDVAFRMLYEAEAMQQEKEEKDGVDASEAQEGKSGGEQRRGKELAEVFHCELFEVGQARPKLRTKQWFVRMKHVLAKQLQQQQQEQRNATFTET